MWNRNFILWLSFIISIEANAGLSFNQPKLCSNAIWNPNAQTVASNNTIGSRPDHIFLDQNNTIYISISALNVVQLWTEGSINASRILSGNLNSPQSSFVTINGDIYVDNGRNHEIDKWILNATNSVPVMNVPSQCTSLFIDRNNSIYCSMVDQNIVMSTSLILTGNISRIVAGNGSIGLTPHTLNQPKGIFVDMTFSLYVADCENDRVQKFQSGELNGSTIVGNGAQQFSPVQCPIGLIFDEDNNLFILEWIGSRVSQLGMNGFVCLVGCSGSSGPLSNQLYYPQSLSFDSFGNIFVGDTSNGRIQKFILATNSCGSISTDGIQTIQSMNISSTDFSDLSFNQPKFNPNASWNINATTFANNITVWTDPSSLFIDRNNTIYLTVKDKNILQIWNEGYINSTRYINLTMNSPNDIFVLKNGDIYISNRYDGEINKWTFNSTNGETVTTAPGPCTQIFIDLQNQFYCSMCDSHQVRKISLNDSSGSWITVAGNGTSQCTPNTLNSPKGIFVDTDLNLYVADWSNNRIQKFENGQLNGLTLLGNGSLESIQLYGPTDVHLDGNGYLFIVDWGNNRIIGSDFYGYRCLFGCYSGAGSTSSTLYYPSNLAFDSYGNIFVLDSGNQRIQKFSLINSFSDRNFSTTIKYDEISTNIVDNNTIQMTSIASIIQEKSSECSPPMITILPNDTSLIHPIEFERSEQFSLSSIINIDCIQSISIIYKWKIFNCTSSCLSEINLDSLLLTTMSELFVPSRTLSYGIYQFELMVKMNISSSLSSSAYVYIEIIPSNLIVYLIPYGNTLIRHTYSNDLILNPGKYSVDPDSDVFDVNDWNYTYYCQIDGSIENETFIPIDNSDNSCFLNQSSWNYGSENIPQSSLIIFANSLIINKTYLFVIHIINRLNPHLQGNGYLFVQIEDTELPIIAISCIICPICLNRYINPSTQLSLYSMCIDNCTSINNIQWNIYQGITNLSTNLIQWIEFLPLNDQFLGINTSHLTIFMENSNISNWKFEVIYSFGLESSISSMEFAMNKPPENGSCRINPLIGQTSTLFTINCFNWFDSNGIKDYSISVYREDSDEELILATTIQSNIELRLPAGDQNTSLINVIVHIRDKFDSVTEFQLESVFVTVDWIEINTFVDILQQSNNEMMNNNSIIKLLNSGNENLIGEIITSLSSTFNRINEQQIQYVITNAISPTSISITPLGNIDRLLSSGYVNGSTVREYNYFLNKYSNVRDYLMTFLVKLPITTSSSIELQSSTLALLTDSTNQLTRTASMYASTKCYQIALVLQLISREISYEDIQRAVQSIAECAANAFTAINQPLQERGLVLDLDFNRSNTYPVDDDTDLESQWANPNLFADGNDFSLETIEKGRNIYYQRETANSIDNQFFKTISLLTSAINIYLNLNQKLIINRSSIYFSLEKLLVKSLSTKVVQLIGNATIRFPSDFNLRRNDNEIISLRTTMQPLAPFGNLFIYSNTNLSRFISFSLIDEDGYDIPISTTRNNPIKFLIPRDINIIIPSMIFQNVTYLNNSNLRFNYNFVNLTKTINLTYSIHIDMYPLDPNLAYLFIYQFDHIPQLNQFDGWTLFCPSNLTMDNLYKYFIDNEHTYSHQSLIFAFRQLNSIEMENYCLKNLTIANPMTFSNSSSKWTSNYEIRVYTSGCYYLDSNNNWQSDGLIVGPLTNVYETECWSIYPQRIAASFNILPIPINWDYVFANINIQKNATISSTIICVSILYLILMIYARFEDKKDLEKIGMTILSDNQKWNDYTYQIIVYTGHRTNAGTESKVHFVIHGEDNKTNIRTFDDPYRKIFQRNGIDSFLMTVPKSLGVLNYLHIWHDNSGKYSSASWFLKYVLIRDLQTMKCYYFLCQRWLAVENDDGMIERLLLVANENETEKYLKKFSEKIYENVSDRHLWFSIFLRLPSNKFSRIQRCTCCFVLLFVTMLFNILYYQQMDQSEEINGFSIGPFYITLEQILIGCLIELFTFLPTLLLIQLFRRLKEKNVDKKQRLTFPWWCLYLAYSLSFLFVAVSIFFIIARSIELGDFKVKKWLTSIIAGLFSSIFLTQPIEILCVTIFYMVFRSKKMNNTEMINDENVFQLAKDEEFHHRDKRLSINVRRRRIHRLNKDEIIEARNRRLKEIRTWSILEEISSYLVFLVILYSISYLNCDNNAFSQVKHLQNSFYNIKHSNNAYTKITTINGYWNWLENTFLPNIRPQKWYNGDRPKDLTGFMNDKSNRLIGWITMRQLRVKSNSCPIRSLNLTCEDDYSLSNEEKRIFQPGWINETRSNYSLSIINAFKYRREDELNNYVCIGSHGNYPSGGYVYEIRGRLSEIRSNISKLHQLKWIDDRTRVIIIEMSLYNPNVEMYISVRFLIELLSTGGIYPSSRIQPFNIPSFTSGVHLILIVIYILFLIYFLIKEIQSLLHLKFSYFSHFWSLINVTIIVSSWTNIAIYIYRYNEAKRIGILFQKTNGYSYINLQYASDINDLFNNLLGISGFFGTIKLLNLCRFNRRLYLFNETLRYAGKDLLHFLLIFIIVFMGFVLLFYQLFNSKNASYSSLFQTSSMLFQMMLMKFNANHFYKGNEILGSIYFSLFILFVVFILMNMFISIIVDSLKIVQNNVQINLNEDQQIFLCLIKKFFQWIGFIKPNKEEIQEEQDIQMRSQYYNSIEYFPVLIDRLMDVLYQLYLTSQHSTNLRPISTRSIQYQIKEKDFAK